MNLSTIKLLKKEIIGDLWAFPAISIIFSFFRIIQGLEPFQHSIIILINILYLF